VLAVVVRLAVVEVQDAAQLQNVAVRSTDKRARGLAVEVCAHYFHASLPSRLLYCGRREGYTNVDDSGSNHK
jgi:hypothetical protein